MCSFEIDNKVALITGGISGIGLSCAKLLLRNGAKGVTIADINTNQEVLDELTTEFGANTVLFIQTDITNYESFEEAFKATWKKFLNIDILINGAGICNDAIWQKEVAVNVNGTIHGVLLAMEKYILNHKSDEGVIINISSIRAVEPAGDRPIYAATKFAIHGMSLAWGCQDHYNRTKIKVIVVCPGSTSTPLISQPANTNLGAPYEEIRKKNAAGSKLVRQTPKACAENIIEIMKKGKSGTAWICEGGESYEYVMADRFLCKN